MDIFRNWLNSVASADNSAPRRGNLVKLQADHRLD